MNVNLQRYCQYSSIYESHRTTSARIDGVNNRIDDLRNGMYLWLVLIGTVITLAGVIAAWSKAKSMLQARRDSKKYMTIEEVERLIETRFKARS